MSSRRTLVSSSRRTSVSSSRRSTVIPTQVGIHRKHPHHYSPCISKITAISIVGTRHAVSVRTQHAVPFAKGWHCLLNTCIQEMKVILILQRTRHVVSLRESRANNDGSCQRHEGTHKRDDVVESWIPASAGMTTLRRTDEVLSSRRTSGSTESILITTARA